MEPSNVITGFSLFWFGLFVCSESWFNMAHRRSAQSAPSCISEREADGTHVVNFITFSVSSYMLKTGRKNISVFFKAESELAKLERQFRILDRDGKAYNRQAREQIHKQR